MKRRGTSQSCRKASSDSSEPAVRERSKRSIAAKRATVRQPARCAGDAHRDRTLRSSSAVISTLAAGGRSMPLSHARPTRTRGLRSLPRLPGPADRPAGATASSGNSSKARCCSSAGRLRSEEHTSELQSPMRISYAVFCLKKKNKKNNLQRTTDNSQITTYYLLHSYTNRE